MNLLPEKIADNKITLVVLHHPFREEMREVRKVEHIPGRSLAEYLSGLLSEEQGVTFVAAVNGRVVKSAWQTVELQPGDIVSVAAEAEGPVAAAAAAWVVGATGAASTAALGVIAGYSVAAMLAYGATYLATTFAIGWGMSQLTSVLSGSEKPQTGTTEADVPASSPTYAWGELRQVEKEGQPIPIVFGRHKVAGQVLNQFTRVQGRDEYLYCLLGVNDGQVTGMYDFRINDQAYSRFKEATVYARWGAADDSAIHGFGEIVQQHHMNVKLDGLGDSHTYATDGDSVDKLSVLLSAPNGCYQINDAGEYRAETVEFLIEYRPVGGSWIEHGTFGLTGQSTDAVRETVDIEGLPPAQYEVRVTRQREAAPDYYHHLETYWESFQEIVTENLTYPGIAKYGFRVKATDQISGSMPAFSCIVERATVEVYDENAEAWVQKNAENPAWATYALLNIYHEVPASKILFNEFEEWATYCDELVDGEPRHRAGVVLDTDSNAWQDIQRVAALGRGKVLKRGTKYGVFVDRPETTVSHLFTMGNIIAETFSLQYLPVSDRANAVEITYTDPDRDYSTQVVALYSDDYKSSANLAKVAHTRFYAAMTRERVVREAAYRLNSNKYLVRAVEFEASVDSFTAQVGDLVYFQHMVPHYDEALGGRIVDAGNDDGSGNPYVQLDQEVTLDGTTSYALVVRLSDDTLVEKTVQAVAAQTTDVLLLTSDWSDLPETYDVYAFGPASTYKKTYRITNITRAQDLTRRITLLEYHSEIYNDASEVLENPTWGEEIKQEAVGVVTHEFLTYGKAGDYQSNIAVSWYPGSNTTGSNWSVWLRDITDGVSLAPAPGVELANMEGAEFEDLGTTINLGTTAETSFTVRPEHLSLGHTYMVYVCPAGEGFADTGYNRSKITIQGKLAPPNDVPSLSATWNVMKRTVILSWTEVDNLDVDHYEVRRGNAWDGGEVVAKSVKGNSTSFPVDEGTSETQTYWIKAVDTSEIYSENATSTQVAVNTADSPLAVPTGLSLSTASGIASDGSDRVTIVATWDSNAEGDAHFHHYELWVTDTASSRTASWTTTNTEFQWEVAPNHEYSVAVRAVDVTGNVTDFCTPETITSAKDNTPPAVPTSVSLTAFFTCLQITWDHGGESDLSHFDVYRNTVDDSGTASKVGSSVRDFTGSVAMFSDEPGDYQTYHYWIKAVDTSGNESAFSAGVSGTKIRIASGDLGAAEVTTSHLADGAVDTAKLADLAVEAGKLADSSVEASKIANAAVGSAAIANLAVGTAHIADASILEAKIGDLSVTTAKIADNAIVGGKIQAGEVSTDHLAASAVTADKISASQLSGITADMGLLTAGVIQSQNWGTSAGVQFDMNNELVRIGGSSDPKLSWDGVTLSVQGQIVVTNGSTGISAFSDAGTLATQSSVDLSTDEVTNKSADHISESTDRKWAAESGADITGNHMASDTANVNGTAASTVEEGASRANTGLNSSGEVIQAIEGPSLPSPTPAANGLFLTGSYLGYYSADDTEWQAYIANDGQFYFGGDASNYLSWNGTTLTIRGYLNADDIQTGSLHADYIEAGTITADRIYSSAGLSNTQLHYTKTGTMSIGQGASVNVSTNANRYPAVTCSDWSVVYLSSYGITSVTFYNQSTARTVRYHFL